MSMYYGVLLTPVEEGKVPDSSRVVELLKWLVEKGDIEAPTEAKPIEIEVKANLEEYGLTEVPKGVIIDGDIELFPFINENLEAFLNTNEEWFIQTDTVYGIKPFVENSLVSIFSLDADFLASLYPADENEGPSNLDSVSLHKGDICTWFGLEPDQNSKIAKSKFALQLVSDMKAGHPINDDEEYFGIMWPLLSESKTLAEIEAILRLKLEGHPHFS